MGKAEKTNKESRCSQTYGFPIYGVAWVPTNNPLLHATKQEDEQEPTTKSSFLVFCGGGGEGRSGIPNTLLLSHLDTSSNLLSPSPMSKLETGDQVPYRMAVHPGGDGLICSFPETCRYFEWDVSKNTDTCTLCLKPSEKVLTQLEDVGQQLVLTFSTDGSTLAIGGEDGHLRVFKWPSMQVILDKADAYSRLKDLSFSSDAKFLVSLGNGGPCRVWDITSSNIVASLPKEKDEVFAFCRFSQTSNAKEILYIAEAGGHILSWDTTSWKRVGSKRIVRDPICAFNVSADGKLLAVGTIQGDIFVVNSVNKRVQAVFRKAHLGIVTALLFSPDSRSFVSVSLDSTARVTLVEENKKQSGLNMWIIFFIVLLAILAYFQKNKVVISY